jgi:hypothetical protein
MAGYAATEHVDGLVHDKLTPPPWLAMEQEEKETSVSCPHTIPSILHGAPPRSVVLIHSGQ